jgi:hypothetical protein
VANNIGAFGFRQFQRLEGGSPTMGMTQCWIASTDANYLFTGDPVFTSSSPGTNLSGNYITGYGLATVSSGGIRGIFMGCEQYIPAAGITRFLPYFGGTVTGSTGDVKAYICDDPQMQWIVQGSSASAITSSFVGLNVGISTTSSGGNTTTGISAVTLSTMFLSTNGLPFRIVDFYSNWAPPGSSQAGTDNTSAGNIVIVEGNNWDRRQLTARSS